MALGQHKSRGAEGRGGAQDGADVLRVGHLVQDDKVARGFRGDVLEQLAQVDHGQRIDQRCQALMHRAVRKQCGQLGQLDPLGREAGSSGIRELGGCRGGRQQAADPTLGIGEGRGYWVVTINPEGTAKAGGGGGVTGFTGEAFMESLAPRHDRP